MEGVSARMFADNHTVAGKPYDIRTHDFIGHGVFENAVLMDTRFMGKGVGPDNGFIGLHHNAGNHGNQTAGGVNLPSIDSGGQCHLIPAGKEGHHHLFQGGVAGTFANTVDGNLRLSGAGFNTGQGIGRGEPQIIVTVNTHDGLVDIGCMRPHVSDQLREFFRYGITYCIRKVDSGGAGRNNRLKYLAKKIPIRSGAVFS